MNIKQTLAFILICLAVVVAPSTTTAQNTFTQAESTTLRSPDGRLELRFELKDNVPYYSLYRDGKDASGLPDNSQFSTPNSQLKYNPYSYTITQKKVTAKTTLKLRMAPCGGFAVSIREIR